MTTLLDIVDPNDGVLSLREAIVSAEPDEEISFGVNGTIELSSNLGQLSITTAMKILGNQQIAIDGGGANRVVNIDDGDPGVEISVELSGLTITGGFSNSDGGGIFNAEELSISNSALILNTSTEDGGGLYSTSGSLDIIDSLISGNVGERGGGIFASAGTISSSTLDNNYAQLSGGGLHIRSSAAVSESTISNNRSGMAGGGIASPTAPVSITQTDIMGNSAFDGGGIYTLSGNLVM
ncbi:MAG: CSLREA domain-containing protein, partial [Planctomycetota bacterium]